MKITRANPSISLFFVYTIGSILLAIFYNATALLVTDWAPLIFWASTAITFLIYTSLSTYLKKALFATSLHLCLPMLSHPIFEFSFLGSNLSFFEYVDKDRIQYRTLLLNVVSIVFVLDVFIQLVTRSLRWAVLLVVILSIVSFPFMFAIPSDASGLLFWSDYCYLLSCATLIIAMRCNLIRCDTRDSSSDLNDMRNVFSAFTFVVLADVLVTTTSLIPWSISYRGGYQGVLYGFELPYSIALGIAFIHIFHSRNYGLFATLALCSFIFFVLFFTNIKSAWMAVLLSLIFAPKIRFLKALIFLGVFAFAGFVIFGGFSIFDEKNSITIRLGTFYVYILSMVDLKNLFFGIAPGLIDFTIRSNLADAVFASDFGSLLSGIDAIFTQELSERDSYSSGGAFLPHNAFLALFSSFGLVVGVVAFLYLVDKPIRLALLAKSECGDMNFLRSLIVFIMLLGFFHPVVFLFPVIFLIEFFYKVQLSSNTSRGV